jgi:hypothetical protein
MSRRKGTQAEQEWKMRARILDLAPALGVTDEDQERLWFLHHTLADNQEFYLAVRTALIRRETPARERARRGGD